MTKFIQTLVESLAVGSFYALIALGYTMVYGILKFINFAHSDVFMVGAWSSYLVARAAGWTDHPAASPIIAVLVTLIAAMVICSTLGYLIQRLAYHPLRNAARLNVLITAIGVSLFIENLTQVSWDLPTHIVNGVATHNTFTIFGTVPRPMPSLIPPDFTLGQIAGVKILLVDVLGFSITLILMGTLDYLVFHTRMGRAMRAVAYSPTVASLMGINVARVVSTTFIIGSSLAGAAGFLYSMKYPTLQQPAHSEWILLGLKAFVAAVVGGIGNIRGAVLGGFLIGFLELFGMAYISTNLRDVYVFSMLIVVLLIRPNGILGRVQMEKL